MALALAKDEHPDMVVSLIVAQINLIAVQLTVRAYAESLGAPGHLWLASLPDMVRGKCRDWGLQWNEALTGGSRSYVCRVTTSAGHQAVLKLAFPEPLLETQISTLVAAEGRGYVQLIAHDIHQGALLLESLGPSVDEFADDVPAILLITAKTLLQAWQVSTEHFVSTHGPSEHKAAGLWTLVNDLATGREVPPAVIDQALRYALERLNARDASRQVLVHGDPHTENLLRVQNVRPGAETGHVFVDPEGFLCEPEYDLGVVVRDWNTQLLISTNPHAQLRTWCEQLAQITGTDAEAIWQWAFLERVTTGLYLAHHGLPQLGAPFLTVANRLLER
jgi:streptomycin 6-kinase